MTTSRVFSGTKKFVVSVVNSNTLKLERGFLIYGKSEAPRITQKYVMQVPATDEAVRRRIAIRNPYGLPKTFRITTSHPDIIKITDQLMSVPPMGKLACEMFFLRSSHHQQTIETLLYISDAETYVQEEAYSVTLVFEEL
ncbi:hypothetical protein GCK72_018119 [Caenorhabditis remanei]|uniref:NPHP4 Ig-like domain-containing protein n=1 Tax=Caenorhabditis remanei TaxID=31234 RepID=A0A6A5GAB6_CAERE|nr:hypothetical protein GCK72_018119 [Caenorhabditis remanei]KAF1751565.1 hypothetical protein GCK72_018119 [Caenorhabditis remanei]